MIIFIKIDNYWATYLPYAFLHMGYHLKKKNIKYKILHNKFSLKFRKEKKEFLYKIEKLKPDIVGFSVITGRQAKDSAEFSIMIKIKIPSIKILWGGIHPTILPEQCIKQEYIDFVLQGEADKTICDFYNELKGEKRFDRVPGCWWKNGKDIYHSDLPIPKLNPDNIGLDFSEVDCSEYIDPYAKMGISIITSRGCPYNCQFCVNQSLDNKRWRPFPLDFVKDTIDFFKSKKIKHIHINDDNFYVNFDRAATILEYAQLPSFSEIRIPTLLKDNRIKILYKLKSEKLMSGAESCDNNILKMLKKGQTYEQLIEAAHLFKIYKQVEPSWSFIIGMPIETLDNINKTISGKEELERTADRIIGPIGIYMPYPGSPLYEIAVKKGFKEPQSPLGWEFERYSRKGRCYPPEHNKFPWVDIKKVWKMAYKYDKRMKPLFKRITYKFRRPLLKRIINRLRRLIS